MTCWSTFHIGGTNLLKEDLGRIRKTLEMDLGGFVENSEGFTKDLSEFAGDSRDFENEFGRIRRGFVRIYRQHYSMNNHLTKELFHWQVGWTR